MKRKFSNLSCRFGISVLLLSMGLIACLLVISCGAATLGSEAPDVVAVDTQTPSFRSDIQLLLTVKCQPCHADTPSQFAPANSPKLPLDDSEEVFSKFLLPVRNRVFFNSNDPMPPDFGTPLSDKEKTALRVYLDNLDAAIQTRGNQEVETTLLFTDVSETLNQSCGRCHSSTANVSPPVLNGLEEYRANNDTVLASIRLGQMPPDEENWNETEKGRRVIEWLLGGKDLRLEETAPQ